MRFLFTTLVALVTTTAFAKKKDSLDIKIGQMIMIGIGDRTSLAADDALAQDLRDGKIGGVVLFEKNITRSNSQDSMQLLIRSLQRQSVIPLFVSIDEEGGRVHRLKEKYGFPAMPSATYLGTLDNPDSTLYYNRRLAMTLKDLGFNLNYAPVLDMAMNPENTVVVKNGRTFGASFEQVAKHAALCIQAHREHGVGTVLKHFPGHGSSLGDTHLGIVDVSNTWSILEMMPYEQLLKNTQVDAVMIGHMVNSRWDGQMLPATLSGETIYLLRRLLNFKGVVFSDDMQMQAISDHYGLEKTLTLTINAGMDMVMFANTLPDKNKHLTATQVHKVIRRLVKNKKIKKERINEAYARIMNMKRTTVGSAL